MSEPTQPPYGQQPGPQQGQPYPAQQPASQQPPAPQPGHAPAAGYAQQPGQPPAGYAQPVAAYPPGAYPPPTPERRRSWFARHKVLTTLGLLVVVAVVVSVAQGGGDDAPPTGAPGAPAPADPGAGTGTGTDTGQDAGQETPGIGTPVADGKFQFVVTQVEPGGTHIGDSMFGEDAQGQFVLVHVTVTNIGTEAQYFDGSAQELTDTAGRTHSADSAAAIYLGDANSFLNQINPGNTVEGIVVFDVPADAVPASLELHDSLFSGGVTVTLS